MVRQVGFAVLAAVDLVAVQVHVVGEAHGGPELRRAQMYVLFFCKTVVGGGRLILADVAKGLDGLCCLESSWRGASALRKMLL